MSDDDHKEDEPRVTVDEEGDKETHAKRATIEPEASSSRADRDKDNEEEEVEVFTLDELLEAQEAQQQLEEDSDAVLGTASEQCTYDFGYMARQPLYACKTCPMKNDPADGSKYLAGFCYACSIACHDEHELVELYTKRNFRCDCGTDRFDGLSCKLVDKAGSINDENVYNHNFAGLYCTCERPYPTPEDTDVQMQCGICEDWYHSLHLNVSSDNQADEIVCMRCAPKYEFLHFYIEEGLVDVVASASLKAPAALTSAASSSAKAEEEAQPEKEKKVIEGCKLQYCKLSYANKHGSELIPQSKCGKTLLFHKTWRSQLCRCTQCLDMYSDLKIGFITSEEDMLVNYERQNLETMRTRRQQQFDRMDHVAKVTYLDGYNKLKRKLTDFLNAFQGKVISRDDVLQFISQELESPSNKRAKVSVPRFCR